MITIDYDSEHYLCVDCEYKQGANCTGKLDLQMMLLNKKDRNIKTGIREWTAKSGLCKGCFSDEDRVVLEVFEKFTKEELIKIYKNNINLLEALGQK